MISDEQVPKWNCTKAGRNCKPKSMRLWSSRSENPCFAVSRRYMRISARCSYELSGWNRATDNATGFFRFNITSSSSFSISSTHTLLDQVVSCMCKVENKNSHNFDETNTSTHHAPMVLTFASPTYTTDEATSSMPTYSNIKLTQLCNLEFNKHIKITTCTCYTTGQFQLTGWSNPQISKVSEFKWTFQIKWETFVAVGEGEKQLNWEYAFRHR